MDTRQQELLKAIDFVRRTFADRQISLDYSADSIKHLDKLFDEEFKNGKLRHPDGGFAKFQGLIMIGISGYLAQVILKNAQGSRIDINENDQNWFINFNIKGENNRAIQPGQQVLQRIQYGNQAGLYNYVLSARRYFSEPGYDMKVQPGPGPVPAKKKPWWKFK